MRFFSQQGEDMYVLKHFINQQTDDGIFVEVGALDGIMYNNTAFLESEMGFTGVLIEPSRHTYPKLSCSRPECICINKAISNSDGIVTFHDDWAMSGILESLPSGHIQNPQHGKGEHYTVQKTTLQKVLKKGRVSYIDFMSIDVEGGELEVLQGMDWSIPVYVICIELDGHSPEKDEKCRSILRENGFDFHVKLNVNEFYVNPAYFRKEQLFNPKNPYVNFDSYDTIFEIGEQIGIEPHLIDFIQETIIGKPLPQ